MRKKRVISPQIIEPEGSEVDAFKELISVEVPQPVVEVPINLPEVPPPEDTLTLNKYLERQVFQEMYGTDDPSHYERTILAIKKRL